MPKVVQSLQLSVVKNEQLICGQCLFGKPIETMRNNIVVQCQVDPQVEEKEEKRFCSRGLWLIQGRVVGFKEGFGLLMKNEESK